MKKTFILIIFLLFSNKVFSSDEKEGRFFEDQPDINDDFQIHFNYVLAADSKDREWDINGKMEEIILNMNKIMEKATKKNKDGGGITKKYKFDYRADGKLDITFVRLGKKIKQLNKYPNDDIIPYLYFQKGMKNNEKIFFNFADLNSPDGGDAGIGFGTLYLKNSSVPSDKRKAIIGLHELLHTQGMGSNCMPWIRSFNLKNHSNHLKNYDQRTMLNSGEKLGRIYAHNIDKCPQLIDSIYLTPTSEDPYDPYQIYCLFKLGKYNHPNFLTIIERLVKKKKYHWKTRFGPSCRTRDYKKDNKGYFLLESNVNILKSKWVKDLF